MADVVKTRSACQPNTDTSASVNVAMSGTATPATRNQVGQTLNTLLTRSVPHFFRLWQNECIKAFSAVLS